MVSESLGRWHKSSGRRVGIICKDANVAADQDDQGLDHRDELVTDESGTNDVEHELDDEPDAELDDESEAEPDDEPDVTVPDSSTVDRQELGDDELSYDFAPWAGDSRSLLASLLEGGDINHAWQGTTLVIPSDAEDEVDRLIDDVLGAAAGALDPGRERVIYEVGSWSAALQMSLVESLTVADVPYEWDEGGDLVVYGDDEEAVERIFDAMPDPDDPDVVDADGVDVAEAVFTLWESAGALAKKLNDASAVVKFVETTVQMERMSVPFGYEPAVWRDICTDAGVVRDALESDESEMSDEELQELAASLHQRLRQFV